LGPTIAPFRGDDSSTRASSIWAVNTIGPTTTVIDPGRVQNVCEEVFRIGRECTSAGVDPLAYNLSTLDHIDHIVGVEAD